MQFIQIIEFTTKRFDEVDALMNEWVSKTEGKRRARRAAVTADRDRADTYVEIVEFPSFEDAMANSDLPETTEFAEKLAQLCDGPAVFRNLDVGRVHELS